MPKPISETWHLGNAETSQPWRAVATVSDYTGPGIEPQTFRADNDGFAFSYEP